MIRQQAVYKWSCVRMNYGTPFITWEQKWLSLRQGGQDTVFIHLLIQFIHPKFVSDFQIIYLFIFLILYFKNMHKVTFDM